MNNYERIINEAKLAAETAVKNATPTAIVVGMAKDITGNEMVPGTEEVWDEGVCGFAWIKVSGRGGFAKYLKENQLGRKGVYGGIEIWSSNLDGYRGQSLERKEASMNAVSEVLSKHGIKNTVYSRMD